MGLKGVFGGMDQVTVLGLKDQCEGLGVIRDEEEENNRVYWRKREGYCQHCVGCQWSYGMSHYVCQGGRIFWCPHVLFIF